MKTRKRQNGSFETRGTVNGKTYSAYGATAKESKQKFEKRLKTVYALTNGRGLTLDDWLNQWLYTYKQPNLRYSSFKSLEICCRLHIPQSIKDKLLVNISTTALQTALNVINSSRMREYTYNTLCAAFRTAQSLEYIFSNPMLNVVKPIHERKQGKAFTLPEQQHFLSVISNHHLKSLFLFYLFTGARRSEALSLDVYDINFSDNVFILRGTKTSSSYRTLPIFEPLKELLTMLCENANSNKIFPYKADYVTKQFKKLCPNHRLHDLRHTFATRCLECDIPIKLVQLWLGHSRLDTTSGIYTHVLDDFQSLQAKKFSLNPLTKH